MDSFIDMQELDRAKANALRGIEPSQSDAANRRPRDRIQMLESDFIELAPALQQRLRKKGAEILGQEDLDDEVEVICLVESLPWDHQGPMAHGERRMVPRKVAAEMKARRHIEIIGDPARSEPSRNPVGRPRKATSDTANPE